MGPNTKLEHIGVISNGSLRMGWLRLVANDRSLSHSSDGHCDVIRIS